MLGCMRAKRQEVADAAGREIMFSRGCCGLDFR